MISNYREKDIKNLFLNKDEFVDIIKVTKGYHNYAEILDVNFMIDVFDFNADLSERELDDFFDTVELMLKGFLSEDSVLEYGYNSSAWRCGDGCCSESDYYSIVIRLKN